MQANCGEYFLKERLVGTIMTVYIGGDNYQFSKQRISL